MEDVLLAFAVLDLIVIVGALAYFKRGFDKSFKKAVEDLNKEVRRVKFRV